MRRIKIASRVSRLREWIMYFIQQYPQVCLFCGKPIDPIKLTRGDNGDGATIHHKDQNRQNNQPSNLGICHRTCHIKFHKNNPVITGVRLIE